MARPKRQAIGDEKLEGKQKRTKVVAASTRVTRSAAKASKQSTIEAVLLTTELLENIMGFLPMKDLLLTQRVSSSWEAVIKKSVTLQQKLFFLPKQADFCWLLDEDAGLEWPQAVARDCIIPKGPQRLRLFRNAQMNPMMFITFGCGDVIEDMCDGSRNVNVLAVDEFYEHPARKRPDASWRRMLTSQPPVRSCFWDGTVTYTSDIEEITWDKTFEGRLRCDHDMTCQDLLKAVEGNFAKSEYMNIGGNAMVYLDEFQMKAALAEQGQPLRVEGA